MIRLRTTKSRLLGPFAKVAMLPAGRKTLADRRPADDRGVATDLDRFDPGRRAVVDDAAGDRRRGAVERLRAGSRRAKADRGERAADHQGPAEAARRRGARKASS